MARSRASVDPVLETQLRRLRDRYKALAAGDARGADAPWIAPERRDWSGGLGDYEGMASPFDRSAANADFARATSDPSDPGTAGDVVVSSFQAHYLACLERAYRDRHLRGIRAAAHAAARAGSLGDNGGPLIRCALGHARDILARANGGTA